LLARVGWSEKVDMVGAKECFANMRAIEKDGRDLLAEIAYLRTQNARMRDLVKRISPWLYSVGSPPKELNDEFLRIFDKGEDA
jgi:hypothetical protein